MKKIVKTIGLACLAGLFAVSVSSCKKTEDNTTKVVLTMENIEDVYPGNERAYINMQSSGRTFWNGNDRIRAYNLNMANDPNAYLSSTTAIYQTSASSENLAYANFYGPNLGSMQSDAYHFFYPVGMVSGVLGPYNVDTFFVAPTQRHTEKYYNGALYTTVDPLAMPLASKNVSLTNFTMHHLFGYLRLHILGQGHVQSVVLTDRAHGLTGYATMNVGKVDATLLKNMVNLFVAHQDADAQQIAIDYVFNPDELCLNMYPQGNTITLELDDEIELDTHMDNVFMFAVRPMSLYDGFDVTLNFSDKPSITISSEEFMSEAGISDLRQWTMRPGKCINITRNIPQD